MTSPPHVPALDPKFEKEPASRVPVWFRPLHGIPYKVSDGDTLANIAVRCGLSAKFILNYNYQTTEPQEVNWYLRNRVGCKIKDPDGKNFAFSTSAEPGIVWLPLYAYQRIKTGPAKYPPEQIIGGFPRYHQKSDNVCWGAAVANIYDWKKGRRRTATEALTEIGSRWGTMYSKGEYMQGPDFSVLAKQAGLRSLSIDGFYDQQDWIDTISRRKPVLMLQKHDAVWTHWIVIVGYSEDNTGFWLRYLDPGDGLKYWGKREDLVEKCRQAASNYPKLWRH